MTSIIVRQAVLSDLAALAVLFDGYRQFYGRPSDVDAAKEFLAARFNHGESVLFIAFEDGVPVGFTQLYPSFSSFRSPGLSSSMIFSLLVMREEKVLPPS